MVDTDLHIVEQVKLAASKREIAQILLRVPDGILMTHHEVLTAECRKARFPDAISYMTVRLVALDAVRDKSGRLPDAVLGPLENWRIAFAAFAQSSPQ